MKYKVLKGTDLFDKLWSIQKKMQSCQDEAQKIVNTIPEADGSSKRSHCLAGGIAAFHFKKGWTNAPDGWRKMEKGWTQWFMPKSSDKKNKELLKKISELPVLGYEIINDLLNFHFYVTEELQVWHCPIVEWRSKYVLIEVPNDKKYKPLDGMIEIMDSEYIKLSKAKNNNL